MTASGFHADEQGLVRACPNCGRANRLSYERLAHEFRCGNCKTALPAPSEPVEVPNSAVFSGLTGRSALPVLVDFWAAWCGPCKMVAPELVKVAKSGERRWLVAKVDTEAVPDLAGRFGISSIPTLAVFKDGREVKRQAGAMSAAAIMQFLQ